MKLNFNNYLIQYIKNIISICNQYKNWDILHFLYYVVTIQYVFYTYSTSQLKLATFQVVNSHI